MQDFFFIRTNRRYELIYMSDIIYIEARTQYMKIVTVHTSFRTLASLKQIEKILPKNRFCKVHRAYMVAFNKIIGFDSEKVYMPGIDIPLAYNCRVPLISGVTIITREIPARSKRCKTVRQIQQDKLKL